ncbi:MAG TPA: HEAT repeat domain-containing protein [Candidatus Dormibacteraeota bacterium]|nr:HEAT repeat domain-containing protein [Candidatus Dormibacteraeota bacterium]
MRPKNGISLAAIFSGVVLSGGNYGCAGGGGSAKPLSSPPMSANMSPSSTPTLRSVAQPPSRKISFAFEETPLPCCTEKLIVWEATTTQTRDALPELKAGSSAEEERQQQELAAIGAAAATGDQAALRNALLSPDPTVATVAFQNLTELDPALAEQAIAGAAKSDQPMTRLKALQLLDQVSEADEGIVLSGLRDALGDQDPGVKVYAVQALAARGVPESIDYLRQAFPDLDLKLKMMVIEAVAHNEEGLPLLQDATADADESVRSAASSWLAQANAVE